MLSEKQENQYIAFVASLVCLLHEETDMTCEQAKCVMEMAASALLGAVLCVPPDDTTANAVAKVIEVAVKREYNRKKHAHLN